MGRLETLATTRGKSTYDFVGRSSSNIERRPLKGRNGRSSAAMHLPATHPERVKPQRSRTSAKSQSRDTEHTKKVTPAVGVRNISTRKRRNPRANSTRVTGVPKGSQVVPSGAMSAQNPTAIRHRRIKKAAKKVPNKVKCRLEKQTCTTSSLRRYPRRVNVKSKYMSKPPKPKQTIPDAQLPLKKRKTNYW